jgi:hypothetical protein
MIVAHIELLVSDSHQQIVCMPEKIIRNESNDIKIRLAISTTIS